MKLIGKNNLRHIFILLIIGSYLLASFSTKSYNKGNKNTKKFRNRGEVCYHSVPHWEEKNGNLPCKTGLICRPPLQHLKSGRSDIPHRCYLDNKKGTKGNIHFTSKKQREDSDSYLFSISLKTPKKFARRSSEGNDLAKLGELCYSSTPGSQNKKCATGLECRSDAMDYNKMGSSSTCHSTVLKEGEICNVSTNQLFIGGKCGEGLECNLQNNNNISGRQLQGATFTKCTKIQYAKEGEICSSSIQGIQSKTCAPDQECRVRAQDINLKGTSATCHRKILREGDICEVTGTSFKKDCGEGLICKPKQNNNALPAGKKIMINEQIVCRPMQIAKKGETCYKSTPDFERKQCEFGLECRLPESSKGLSGASSQCLTPIAKEGEECYKSIPSYVKKECSHGLECRARGEDLQAGKTGVTMYCKSSQQKNIITLEVAGVDQVCNKSTPGFTSKQCVAGTVCRIKDSQVGMTGVSMYCLPGVSNGESSTTISSLKIGQKCSAGGSKQCPSGHACKYPIGEKTGNTYCLLPSAFDTPNYVPFVGVNNYCDITNKPCTSGSTCTRVYDGTNVCVATSYDLNGNPHSSTVTSNSSNSSTTIIKKTITVSRRRRRL
mgnify:CR=1 FL=1